MYGVKQEALQFNQGVDIRIPVELKENGIAVDYRDYTLTVKLKSDISNGPLVWEGINNFGLDTSTNQIYIVIPSNVAKDLRSGIYFLAINGVSLLDPAHSAVLYQLTISLNQTAASTQPTGMASPTIYVPVPSLPLITVVPIQYNF